MASTYASAALDYSRMLSQYLQRLSRPRAEEETHLDVVNVVNVAELTVAKE